MKINKTIDLSNFSIEKTTYFGLTGKGSKAEKKDNLVHYVDDLKARFPSAVETMAKKEMTAPNPDKFLIYFHNYTLENDNINVIRPLVLQQINDLLEVKEDDSEITKLLKEVGQSQKETIEGDFNALKDIAPMIFILDSIKDFYLQTLPKYIQEQLGSDVKFEASDQEKLTNILTNEDNGIFTAFYSVNRVEEETDMNDFQTNISNRLNDLDDLIKSVRDSKKPVENVEELTKLRESWITNFANRVIEGGEYLKNKELSADAINEVGKSLKDYDDTFSYMFTDFKSSDVKNWWLKVRPFWKDNFAKRWGNEAGGIEEKTLTNLKNYIEGKEKEMVDLKNQLEKSPKSEDLEKIKKDLEAKNAELKQLKDELEKQPELIKSDSELSKENEKLWNHVDYLTEVIEKITPNNKPK